MKFSKLFIAMSALVLFFPVHGFAQTQEVKVIANKSITTTEVTPRDLHGIFMMDRETLDGVALKPVLEKGGPVHEVFLNKYLHCQDATLQAYYKALVFTGKASMPKVVTSDAEVVAFVASTKGAIGYVSASTAVSNVNTLVIKP